MNSLHSEATHTVWSWGYAHQSISDGLVLLTYGSAHGGERMNP